MKECVFIQMEDNSAAGVFAYEKEQPSPTNENQSSCHVTIFLSFSLVAILVFGKSVQFRVKYIENG